MVLLFGFELLLEWVGVEGSAMEADAQSGEDGDAAEKGDGGSGWII